MILRGLRLFLTFALLALIALSPLPLGGNRPWAWSPLALIVGLLLIGIGVLWAAEPTYPSRITRSLVWPLLLTSIVLLWMVLQAWPGVPSSWNNPVRAAANTSLIPNYTSYLGLDPERTIVGIMRLLSYIGVFAVAAALCGDAKVARAIFVTHVTAATAYTTYSFCAMVVNHTAGATGWFVPVPHEGQFTGTFINRNNYATYAATAAVVAISMSFQMMRPAFSLGERSPMSWLRAFTNISGRGAVFLGAAIILIAGVVSSGSRGAAVSLLIGLGALVTLTAYTRKVGWPSLSIASFIIFGVVVLSGSDLFSRMRSIVQTALPDRLALYEAVLHAISLRPALGWGANSFQDLFPLFQPVTMDPHYDKAHNTYLELAFELGMPAATALIVAVIIIALRCLRGARERKQNQYIPVCTLAVTVVVSVHALVDFGLQIAAIAIIFSAILGAGWRQSFSSRL